MALNTWPLTIITFTITLLIAAIIPKSIAQPTYLYAICPNTTFYANNSRYHTNLNTLLRSLSSNATANSAGFHYTSINNGTKNAVYGLFLCRGDQNTSSCSDCVTTATSDLINVDCPNRRIATTWYDECMVRYSNESFLGRMSQAPRFRLMNTQNVTGNMTHFTQTFGNLMNDIAIRAANGGSRRKFATGVVGYSSLQTMYGLVQCTPDLSASDCNQCLRIAIGVLPISLGGRTIMASCYVRYEVYPFFNGAANISVPPPSPLGGTNSSSVGPGLSLPSEQRNSSTRLIIAIVVPVAAVSLALLAICFCLIRKRKAKKANVIAEESKSEDFTTTESLQYDLTTLQSATNNFSEGNKLGEGGFGVVYKGTLSNGQEIAVKRLSKTSTQGIEEFRNEIILVAKLQHRNLVRLFGFCLAGEEKLLVYDYVPNQSLDNFLFDSEKSEGLDWIKRYKIIQGIARGMLYLHQDSRLTVIHRDLKSSNILLDANMNPKISDFGLAKIFGGDQTEGNTSKVIGTYGYMSPEYAMHGKFSVKSDVYSFGVLILEIISGKRNSTFYESGYVEDLISYAWNLWRDQLPLDIIDPSIRESCSSNEVLRCLHLGLLCVQESIDERPTMATIVLTLDSDSVTLPMPQQPAFFTKTKEESSQWTSSKQSSKKTVTWSLNDDSITEVEPR